MTAPELYVPFQYPSGQAPRVSQVRSTLVVSSIQSLRSRGLFDRYAMALAPRDREDMLSLIAGTWIPLEQAELHYRTLDGLALARADIESIGGDVAQRVNRTVLSTIVRASRSAGVTPWTLLSNVHRFRALSWRGSDISIVKLGPKDARFEWVAQPLAAVPYFVVSFGAYIVSLSSLFSTRAYARIERGAPSGSERILYRLSWA